MINFEEELKKFKPSLEIEDAEDIIYNQDLRLWRGKLFPVFLFIVQLRTIGFFIITQGFPAYHPLL